MTLSFSFSFIVYCWCAHQRLFINIPFFYARALAAMSRGSFLNTSRPSSDSRFNPSHYIISLSRILPNLSIKCPKKLFPDYTVICIYLFREPMPITPISYPLLIFFHAWWFSLQTIFHHSNIYCLVLINSTDYCNVIVVRV